MIGGEVNEDQSKLYTLKDRKENRLNKINK